MPQTLDSSLLYNKEDGTQDFVHDSYKDFFLARWFANRINDGRLSVEDAYRKYWSYEEDKELWDLPKDREWRGLLPGWEKVLLYIVKMLDDNKAQELVNITSEGYFKIKEFLDINDYNPFDSEIRIINTIFDYLPCKKKEIERRLNITFPTVKKMEEPLFSYSDQSCLDVIESRENPTIGEFRDKKSNRFYLDLDGFFLGDDSEKSKFYLKKLIEDGELEINPEVFRLLGKSGHEYVFKAFSDILPSIIDQYAQVILSNGKTYKFKNGNSFEWELWTSFFHIMGIAKCGKEKAIGIVGELSTHSNTWLRYCATRALGVTECIQAEEYLIKRLKDEEKVIQRFALVSLALIGSRKGLESIFKLLDEDQIYHQLATSTLRKMGGRREIEELLKRNLSRDSTYHYLIYSIHQRLKPQGYNPPVKRLVA